MHLVSLVHVSCLVCIMMAMCVNRSGHPLARTLIPVDFILLAFMKEKQFTKKCSLFWSQGHCHMGVCADYRGHASLPLEVVQQNWPYWTCTTLRINIDVWCLCTCTDLIYYHCVIVPVWSLSRGLFHHCHISLQFTHPNLFDMKLRKQKLNPVCFKHSIFSITVVTKLPKSEEACNLLGVDIDHSPASSNVILQRGK